MEYLHSKGICHRDIKPENLLINDRHMLCICDFNSAIQFNKSTNPMGYVYDTVGTPSFWCPESVKINSDSGNSNDSGSGSGIGSDTNMYSAYHADIWAAGICVYCFLYNTLPFQEVTIAHSNSVLKLDPETERKLDVLGVELDNFHNAHNGHSGNNNDGSIGDSSNSSSTGDQFGFALHETDMDDLCVDIEDMSECKVGFDSTGVTGVTRQTGYTGPIGGMSGMKQHIPIDTDRDRDMPIQSTHNDMLQLFDRICTIQPIFPLSIATSLDNSSTVGQYTHSCDVSNPIPGEIDSNMGELVCYISDDAIQLCSSMLRKNFSTKATKAANAKKTKKTNTDTNTSSDDMNKSSGVRPSPPKSTNDSNIDVRSESKSEQESFTFTSTSTSLLESPPDTCRLVDIESILNHPWVTHSKVIYNKRHKVHE